MQRPRLLTTGLLAALGDRAVLSSVSGWTQPSDASRFPGIDGWINGETGPSGRATLVTSGPNPASTHCAPFPTLRHHARHAAGAVAGSTRGEETCRFTGGPRLNWYELEGSRDRKHEALVCAPRRDGWDCGTWRRRPGSQARHALLDEPERRLPG
jgi:hypothetical protein